MNNMLNNIFIKKEDLIKFLKIKWQKFTNYNDKSYLSEQLVNDFWEFENLDIEKQVNIKRIFWKNIWLFVKKEYILKLIYIILEEKEQFLKENKLIINKIEQWLSHKWFWNKEQIKELENLLLELDFSWQIISYDVIKSIWELKKIINK